MVQTMDHKLRLLSYIFRTIVVYSEYSILG